MKTFVNMVYASELVSTDAAKYALIKTLSPTGKKLAQEALHPYRVFHTKQVERPRSYQKQDGEVKHFLELLDALHSRTYTGTLARDMVTRTLARYTERTAGALERVLIKNLRVGATAKTFNKAFPGLVPTFDLQLADVVDNPSEIEYPKLAEVKYDGMRNVAVVTPGAVQHFSRKGIEQEDYHVFDEELKRLRTRMQGGSAGMVFDGEVLARDFQQTMKRGVARDLSFFIFDYMTLTEWQDKHSVLAQSQRRMSLLVALESDPYTLLSLSKGSIVDSAAEAMEFYEAEKKASGGRFKEGLIIKDMNAPYAWKRGEHWIKWKPTRTWDLVVTGWQFGEKGGRHEKTLGAMVCKGVDEDGDTIITNVGNGIPDDLRAKLFQLAKTGKLVGLTVEVLADTKTQAEGIKTFSLRFPRVSKIRWDK